MISIDDMKKIKNSNSLRLVSGLAGNTTGIFEDPLNIARILEHRQDLKT